MSRKPSRLPSYVSVLHIEAGEGGHSGNADRTYTFAKPFASTPMYVERHDTDITLVSVSPTQIVFHNNSAAGRWSRFIAMETTC